jgi:tetratricopeptide (TPR) repeat protein
MGRSFTLLMIMFLALLTGCASKLLVVTEPSGAEVYLRTLGGEEKLAGKTPLELSDVEIRDLLRLGSTQAQFIQVRLSLVAFEEMNLFVPSSKWGQRRSLIKLTMTPVKESISKKVNEVVKRFYSAQKLVEARQYELAHLEVNRILEVDAMIPQAHAIRGAAFYLQGRLKESLESYQEVLRLDPQYPEAIKMIEKIQQSQVKESP